MIKTLLLFFLTGFLVACAPPGSSVQRLSIATGGTGGVYYPYGGGIAKVISSHVPGVEATAEVTAASIDNLKFLRDGKADLGFTLADSLEEGLRGRGAFADGGATPFRALVVLYDNYTHIATLDGSGIASIHDLRGKVVSTGAAGSGTELIAKRVLEASGLNPDTDIRKQSLGAAQSVDALKDGKVDAFFWSGGLPTGSVLDLATTARRPLYLLENATVLATLQARYGSTVYHTLFIPADAYPGIAEEVPVIGVHNILVVHERMPAELTYLITKALFEYRQELEAVHSEARNLTLESAITGSPAPFHDGAIRYYRERGVWTDR